MEIIFHQTLGSFAIELIRGEYVVVDSYEKTQILLELSVELHSTLLV